MYIVVRKFSRRGSMERGEAELEIEIHVMIRPRAGNFVYSEAELEVIAVLYKFLISNLYFVL